MSHECICGKDFKSPSGLYRHKKKCKKFIAIDRYDDLLMQKISLEEKLQELQKENKQLTNKTIRLEKKNALAEQKAKYLEDTNAKLVHENTEFKQQVDKLSGQYLQQVDKLSGQYFRTVNDEFKAKNEQIVGAGNIIGNQSRSQLKLLQKYASDAPVLKYELSDTAIKEQIQEQIQGADKDNIGMVLIDHFTEGDLHAILGDLLVSYYQEDNVKMQSLWSTDVARLTYLVKDFTKKGSIWTQDKKGNKVKEAIIKPLLLKVRTIVDKFYKKIKRQDATPLRLRVEDGAIKLLHEIGYTKNKNASILADKINKHVASHMHFEEKHMLGLEKV